MSENQVRVFKYFTSTDSDECIRHEFYAEFDESIMFVNDAGNTWFDSQKFMLNNPDKYTPLYGFNNKNIGFVSNGDSCEMYMDFRHLLNPCNMLVMQSKALEYDITKKYCNFFFYEGSMDI